MCKPYPRVNKISVQNHRFLKIFSRNLVFLSQIIVRAYCEPRKRVLRVIFNKILLKKKKKNFKLPEKKIILNCKKEKFK
jgi:hypothetical protein